MTKQKALVICPGRGTYNAADLGYLRTHHNGGGRLVKQLDALRQSAGQPSISALDQAAKFQPSLHMSGDNASLLIYACALADFAAIDRDSFDIVAVTGNSMGWYLALAVSGALDVLAGARLVNTMGLLMHQQGKGGQIVWSLMDDDWCIDPKKKNFADAVLTEASGRNDLEIHISINLGGMIVFASNDAGLEWLMQKLPKDDRFPMRLNYHAAFHSLLLDHIIPTAKNANADAPFGNASIPLIDGTGRIWSPSAYDQRAIYDYTLGHQINSTYDFTTAVKVAAFEFMPDTIIVLGPGATMGAPTAQALIASGWRGLAGKNDFIARQAADPFLMSMGIAEQRALVTRPKDQA
jgi:[acyl-carrier-protein] S-malonyltransferase